MTNEIKNITATILGMNEKTQIQPDQMRRVCFHNSEGRNYCIAHMVKTGATIACPLPDGKCLNPDGPLVRTEDIPQSN